MPDPRLLEVAAAFLAPGDRVATPSPSVARRLSAGGAQVTVAAPADVEPGGCDAVVLVDDELSAAGEDAEALVAHVEQALRPGGVAVVGALGAVLARVTGADLGASRAYTAEQLTRVVGHRGFALELLCAPGAAARLAGQATGPLDLPHDRMPGLLDAGERLLVVARKGRDRDERSAAFFATLPRKVVAAAVLCRDDDDGCWSSTTASSGTGRSPGCRRSGRGSSQRSRPGGMEEAGVRVDADAVLGVFAASWPERLVFVYAARPRDGRAGPTAPRHAHEIDAVAWVSLDEALDRLAPHVAEQVRRCLTQPGQTWFQASGS